MKNDDETVTDVVSDRTLNIVKKLREKLTDSEIVLLSRALEADHERLSEFLLHEVAKVIVSVTGEVK